jgi:S-adenosylmethionine/arginine decarboxylase-like enzyme
MGLLNHKHILVKATVSRPIRDEKDLKLFFYELVRDVNMKVVCGPTVKYVPSEGKEGLTGSVNIETSHASIHIWDETTPPYIQFDLYSCSDFTAQTVLDCLHRWMGLTGYEYILIDRNEELKVIEHEQKGLRL